MMSVASRDIKLLLHEESNRIDDLLAKSPIGPGKRAIFKKFFESYEDSADEAGDAEAVEKGYDGDVENEEVEVTRKKSTTRNHVCHRVHTASPSEFSSDSESNFRVVRKRLNSDASSDPDSDSSDGTIDYVPTDGAGEEIVQIVSSGASQ